MDIIRDSQELKAVYFEQQIHFSGRLMHENKNFSRICGKYTKFLKFKKLPQKKCVSEVQSFLL